jgi:hypothetical protein
MTRRIDRSRAPRAEPRRLPEPVLVATSAEAVLALQRSAGNAAVTALLARSSGSTGGAVGWPPPRGFSEAARANAWLQDAPMRVVNSLLDLPNADAGFTVDTFWALDVLRSGPSDPGVIDDAILELLLERAVDRGQQTQFAHVIEARIFNGARLDLSMRFDPALRAPSAVVAEGALQLITLGPAAFADLATLQKTVGKAIPPVAGSRGKAAPRLLAGDAVKAAVLNNSNALTDLVTGAIVSDAIGGDNDDHTSEDFAQWLADFQARRKLAVNGQLNESTMREIVERLRAKGHFDSILRLVVDYGMLDRNVVADARYNPDATDEFWIDRRPGGTSARSATHDAVTVDFGPKAFLGDYAGIFHTVADAFKRVEARHDRLSEGEQRLLGKAQQLLPGVRGGPRESGAALRADVRDFLAMWKALRPADESRPDPRQPYLQLLDDVVTGTEERFKALGQLDASELRQLKFIQKAMQP